MTAIAPPPAAIPTAPTVMPLSPKSDAKPVVSVSVADAHDDADQSTDAKSPMAAPPARPAPDAAAGIEQHPPARPTSGMRSKFDLEPNPFEQSFSRSSHSSERDRTTPPRGGDATSVKHNALPPLSSLTSPAAADPSQFPWLAGHSLRSGPLSPAMLAGPAQSNGNLNPNAAQRGTEPPGNEAFESATFRTGFTPGAGTGFTPGYSALMNSNFGALPMPSPNTAAFLNSITNGTPLAEGIDPATAVYADGQQPSGLPPHLQQSHGLSHLNPHHGAPQETITPGTLSALTGVINDMNRQQANGIQGPVYYPPDIAPSGAPGLAPPGLPQVDYAQQSANAASQAANGLFLLSQAHQELSKREEEAKSTTPLMGKRTAVGSAPPGSGKASGAGQKRKDSSAAGGKGATAKRGKKNSPAVRKEESTSPGYSSDEDKGDDDANMSSSNKNETEEEKRKNFLERNRQAALKCRQRKKAWLNELQNKVETLSMDNERLQQTIQGLHEEVGRLSSILMQHRDCGLGIATMAPAYGRPLR